MIIDARDPIPLDNLSYGGCVLHEGEYYIYAYKGDDPMFVNLDSGQVVDDLKFYTIMHAKVVVTGPIMTRDEDG